MSGLPATRSRTTLDTRIHPRARGRAPARRSAQSCRRIRRLPVARRRCGCRSERAPAASRRRIRRQRGAGSTSRKKPRAVRWRTPAWSRRLACRRPYPPCAAVTSWIPTWCCCRRPSHAWSPRRASSSSTSFREPPHSASAETSGSERSSTRHVRDAARTLHARRSSFRRR